MAFERNILVETFFFLVLQLRVLFACGDDERDAEINKDRLHLGGETCKTYQKCAIFMYLCIIKVKREVQSNGLKHTRLSTI